MTTCDIAANMAADATFAFCNAYGICQIALIVAAVRTSLTNLLSRVRRGRASTIALCTSRARHRCGPDACTPCCRRRDNLQVAALAMAEEIRKQAAFAADARLNSRRRGERLHPEVAGLVSELPARALIGHVRTRRKRLASANPTNGRLSAAK
jgi:hypothetical protein